MSDDPTDGGDTEPDGDAGEEVAAEETVAPADDETVAPVERDSERRYTLGSSVGQDLARSYARFGANEAIANNADLSRIIASLNENIRASVLKQANIGAMISSVVNANNIQLEQIARTAALFTSQVMGDARSVASLYPALQLHRGSRPSTAPRESRSAFAFFDTHAVVIDSVSTLLKALYKVQQKQHEHRLVWRGQQDASWEVHSSLYRQLAEKGAVDEDRIVAAEIEELRQAERWGQDLTRPLNFFAELQHHGAPTRLIDVSTDPEMACWFAVEEHPEHDGADGLVLAWGRSPRVGRHVAAPNENLPALFGDTPFWHAWEDNEHRRPADWGTGTRTWTWFPPALSDRMRAQRAGFLLEAGPILTSDVVEVFTDVLEKDWRASEIARATSIVGLPSRHDVLTKPNKANLVPVFAFRILADAKEPIRTYLEGKGLHYSSVYPDFGGLVQHLRGPYGPR
ncbi:FRG domain-containing protein [Microbacterium sp. PF5]|uniref:FRG domain-containing protein n=1 Tax=Microbacterium sp. PF5 TaxID=2305435 RepID=UPI00109BB62F|nr:FRG domain-containing protein [Microbacterium sp. PF5]